jgi:hypothetical protein
MKTALKVTMIILAPVIATILSLITKNILLTYFEVELDAGDRLFTTYEIILLPLAYIIFLMACFIAFTKKSTGFVLAVSQIGFLITTSLYHLYIYRDSFYTIGQAA